MFQGAYLAIMPCYRLKCVHFYIEKAMNRIFTLIPYLQSYNTLPFYLANLGIAG
ncbi:hypothetical protein KLQU111871_25575 [Klebsiella quasivariicola]|uniref:Uncharacterized protein n=1 Tax=Klebsiella quasivariicola TaxID=2026240 RepID=A0A8B4TVC2_9ENTR|nr:Uncharacterised protein [Klebsiella quasivariicola]SXD46986.1 Uncharacterised protein [Klebsiella quasivariicola]SXD97031.1 Uncharacterised protein [Klebsiella quasivariicola]